MFITCVLFGQQFGCTEDNVRDNGKQSKLLRWVGER